MYQSYKKKPKKNRTKTKNRNIDEGWMDDESVKWFLMLSVTISQEKYINYDKAYSIVARYFKNTVSYV